MAVVKFNHPDERQLLRRVSVCPVPDDATGNASYVLGWTGSNLTTVQKTIAGVSWTQTLSYDGSDNLTGVSVWVAD